ncbi:MAG TPA: amidohydrolase family protein [Candidatus Paceibacterota bacterium]
MTIEGNIVTKDKTFRGRIEIDQSGIINKIGSPTGVADFIFKDELIFPGFIDLHIHAREDVSHSQDYKEDFTSAGEAAIAGGVVAMADMPNNKVPPIDDASYDEKSELAKKSAVPILCYAGIGPTTKPLHKRVPYKAFMGPSVGDLFFTSNEGLEAAISKYRGEDISFHCEDPKILEDSLQARTHEGRRPAEAEVSAVDLALHLIEKYKLQGKICHVSTLEGVQKIVNAKNRGVNVVLEVTPHHLYFDETMIEAAGRVKFQVNPPIRQSRMNCLGLIEMLKRGEIDYLATDHAPHSVEEKQKGISGLTHLDTFGPFVAWLMKEHGFAPEEAAQVCSENPGKFINKFLPEKYGEIKEGYAGSLAVIDMGKKFKVASENLKTKSKWSPFLGLTFPGSVVMTVVKGKILKNETQ